ncbi:TPA: hypothetical protein NV714_000084 [Escherichia coli]|nr:hypothetical protein [Escherichia coli]
MIIPELNEFVNSYIIYIDNQQKNDIVKNFSIPSGNLPLIKNIFELKHSNSFEIQDIEDKLLSSFHILDDEQKKLLHNYWHSFFSEDFSLNKQNEFFFENNYKILNYEERKILFFLINCIVEKKFLLNYDEFCDYNKYLIKNFINTYLFNVIQYSSDINWIYFSRLKIIIPNMLFSEYKIYNIFPEFLSNKLFSVTYVEGALDLFTYKLFFPKNNFKIAGSSSSIIFMSEQQLNKNNLIHNNFIIDRDGYSNKAIEILTSKYVFVNLFSEIENFWLLPEILKLWLQCLNFTNEEIKSILIFNENNIIQKATSNLELTFNRLEKRQYYIKQQNLPYLTEKELTLLKNKWHSSIKHKDIIYILSWYDNKNLLDSLLKHIKLKNIKHWQHLLVKNDFNIKDKHYFNYIQI